MDAGYDPKEFVFGNIAYSVGAVGGIAGTLKTLVRGEIKEFSDVFNETRHHALDRMVMHAKAVGGNAVVGVRTNVLHFAGFHEMYMAGTAALHPLLPPETRGAPRFQRPDRRRALGHDAAWIRADQTPHINLGVLARRDRRHQSGFPEPGEGELGDLTALIYEAREQVFDRVNREATALGAEEVVGIKTYIVELGSSLVEIFAVGTAVRKLPGIKVQTAALPAQAIIRDKDTWVNGASGPRNSIVPRRRLSENS